MKNEMTMRWNAPSGATANVEPLHTLTQPIERRVKRNSERASIYFVGPYKPIMCGIADYTSYITRESPVGRWGMLSFDLEKYGDSLTGDEVATEGVWYGIPGRQGFSAPMILEGLKKLGAKKEDSVLWFQHEFGIWPDSIQFVAMLKNLDVPKVVTFHTLHFQTIETPSGLRREQYDLLQALLPHVEAITVFNDGVYHAVTSAFPEYREKVYAIKHGIHSYSEISRMSRKDVKEKFNDFLLYKSSLDQETKELLHQQRIFLDPDTIVIGQTGFLSPGEGSELLYSVRDSLQEEIPHKRIAAVRIGVSRDRPQEIYTKRLQRVQKGRLNFRLETWLPEDILPLAQRAFDVNFKWPGDCTQSGVLAHALGAGAVIAGRDLEGVGETLKDAGQPADTELKRLEMKIVNFILNPELREGIEERALSYATEFSWENQARRHYELAEHVLPPDPHTVGAVPISPNRNLGYSSN